MTYFNTLQLCIKGIVQVQEQWIVQVQEQEMLGVSILASPDTADSGLDYGDISGKRKK